jgi:hypothetical protein
VLMWEVVPVVESFLSSSDGGVLGDVDLGYFQGLVIFNCKKKRASIIHASENRHVDFTASLHTARFKRSECWLGMFKDSEGA